MSGDPIVIEGSAFPRHEFVFGECLRCNWRRRGNYIYSPTAWQVSAKYAKACFALRTEHEPDSWPSMRHAHCGGWMAERPLTGEWASDYVTLEPFWMALSRAERLRLAFKGLHESLRIGPIPLPIHSDPARQRSTSLPKYAGSGHESAQGLAQADSRRQGARLACRAHGAQSPRIQIPAGRHGLHGIHAVGLSRNEEHTEDAETLRLARVNCSAKPNSCP